ncbi:MAG: hypothetical protein ACXIUL_09800 [Wenzhouxiangella sp.]
MFFRLCIAAVVAGLFVGCASSPGPAPSPEAIDSVYLAFETEGGLEQVARGDDRLLYSQVAASAGQQRLQYRVDYALRSGLLARSLSEEGDRSADLPSELGRQMITQAVEFSLPESLGAPITLDVQNRQELRWAFNGEARAESTQAALNWQPEHFALNLAWAPPRRTVDASQPLDCNAGANFRLLSVPMVDESAVDYSRRACQVLAPARGVAELDVATDGLAWRWGAGYEQALRVRRVRPYWQQQGNEPIEPAYELSLAHRQSLAKWQLGMDLAWRRFDRERAISEVNLPDRWALDLRLERDLGPLAVTARWLHANDPLWFLPLATPVERERVSLGLDFSRWLLQSVPVADGKMSASIDYVEDAAGVDHQQVQWSIELTW